MKEAKLELLGLTKYESLAYEALIRLGKAGASEISRESNVPYGRIYDTLNSLVSKGLVSVIPEKSKKFVAAPPEVFENLLNKRIEEMNHLKETVKHMKSIYTPIEEPVEIAKGKRNFYKIIKKMPETKQYAYTIKFTSETKPEWIREWRNLIKKDVDARVLVKYSEDTKSNIEKWKKLVPRLKQRKFEIDNIAGEIIDDKATFFTLVESNVTILIRDKQFAKLMRKFYEAVWEKAEKI